VVCRRDGKWMHYRLTRPNNSYAAAVLTAVRDWLVYDPAMQADRGRLLRLCCSPTLPAPLKKAPKPPGIVTAH
jgi:ArsR family transcriptional regulator, arsenate/arsenite/antimonite-responsive transcriptional repressor